jgi:hypothetical protein
VNGSTPLVYDIQSPLFREEIPSLAAWLMTSEREHVILVREAGKLPGSDVACASFQPSLESRTLITAGLQNEISLTLLSAGSQ